MRRADVISLLVGIVVVLVILVLLRELGVTFTFGD